MRNKRVRGQSELGEAQEENAVIIDYEALAQVPHTLHTCFCGHLYRNSAYVQTTVI